MKRKNWDVLERAVELGLSGIYHDWLDEIEALRAKTSRLLLEIDTKDEALRRLQRECDQARRTAEARGEALDDLWKN